MTGGTVTVDWMPNGPVSPDPLVMDAGGTFAMTIYQSDGHIGASDTFVLEDCDLSNTTSVWFSLSGIARGGFSPGDIRLSDFEQPTEGHIGSGGDSSVLSDVYFQGSLAITGALTTTWTTTGWAGELQPVGLSFSTSASASETLAVFLTAGYAWEHGIPDISQTVTLDIVIDVIGTAHLVPDPSLVGVAALGIGGASAWLQRRRT